VDANVFMQLSFLFVESLQLSLVSPDEPIAAHRSICFQCATCASCNRGHLATLAHDAARRPPKSALSVFFLKLPTSRTTRPGRLVSLALKFGAIEFAHRVSAGECEACKGVVHRDFNAVRAMACGCASDTVKK
jgi:hypothetical protein